MSDDLTPPTPEPMDDAARARVRQRVLAGTDDRTGREDQRRWLLAAAAAVTVVALAAVTGYVTIGSDDEPALAPAGSPGRSWTDSYLSPSPSSTPTDPTESLTVVPIPPGAVSVVVETLPDGTKVYRDAKNGDVYGIGEPPPGFEFLDPDYTSPDAESCRQEAGSELPGASAVTSFPSTLGMTMFYVAGKQWVLCDNSGGVATVHGARPLIPDGRHADFDVSTSNVSADEGPDSTAASVFVAGGAVPAGGTAFSISYTFPDGHVEKATTTVDDQGRTWWRMEYTAETGPLADPDTNQGALDPIEVTVDTEDGSQGFTLDWGTDTCAQVNHGC